MKFGDYRIEIIPDSEFRLDGGAMFGVVPRVLWEKKCPPDALNRIRMNMNCLFIDTGSEKILVETGIGEKWTADEEERFGIFRTRSLAATLRDKTGFGPDDISIVVNTHLHFDHAGGNTILDSRSGLAVPQFKNARYLVSKSEFDAAESPTERDRASYRHENWRPLSESGQLELMPDEYEVVPGLKMQQVRGHSATMQTVRLSRGQETLYGFADLIPTTAHIPYAWIMGYDLFPLETLAAKKSLLPAAVAENWLCLFYHDIERPLCRLTGTGSKIFVAD